MKFSVRIYLVEVLKGLKLTMGKLIYNLLHRDKMPTISYPDERRPISIRLRSMHRLLKRPDDKPRCVACMLCATACPAVCIHIEANEESDKSIEKYPAKFEIDLLRCVFCGFCVEACPCDAIRMDTGIYEITGYERKTFVVNREQLLANQVMPGVPDVATPKTLPGVFSKPRTHAHEGPSGH